MRARALHTAQPEHGWTVLWQGKWKGGSTGRVNEAMLKRELFEPGEESLAMMCGPPGMQDACTGVLQTWGYTKEQVIVF